MSTNQTNVPLPPRPPIDEIVRERCEQFALVLMAEVPEVTAMGFVIASPYLNSDVLSGFLFGPKPGQVPSPIAILQLSRALTNVGAHVWGHLLPQLLQGLEDLAEERARLINEQARPLARMGQPAESSTPPRHPDQEAEGHASTLDGQHG